MKEKILSVIIIGLAIIAIVYKVQKDEKITFENNITKNNSLNLEDNMAIEDNEENQNLDNNENSLVINLTKENFEEEVLKSSKTVIVDFYANWCGPCKVMSPVLEEIAKENEEIKVCKLNVDYEQELAIEYGAQYLPTILIIKDGEVTNKIVGIQQKAFILEKCK